MAFFSVSMICMVVRWVYYWVCGCGSIRRWLGVVAYRGPTSCLSLSSLTLLIIRGLISSGGETRSLDSWRPRGPRDATREKNAGGGKARAQGRGKLVGHGRSVQLRADVTREVCWFHLRVTLRVEGSQARGKLLLCRV